MKNKYNQRVHCTPYQLELPLEISKKIKISDPVYTFCEVFDHIDLNKYLAVKESRTGRKRYDSKILLKVILFAFMEFGYTSTREIEKLCNNDIRFMWLLQDNPAPSHMTIDNFMKDYLADCIKGNKYGRTEELYQCEDCSNCEHKENCCKSKGNRTIRLNEELTSVHQEVLNNLNSTKGALLRINRSIQAEGAFGTIKWNRAYTRAKRRGLKGINLEISMICCGFNLHKYHLKSQSQQRAA